MTANRKIRVALTSGDPNGIGYEIILKLLEDQRIADLATIIVYGSAKAAAFYRKAMELPQVQLQRVDSAADAADGEFSIVNVVPEDLKIDPGTPSEVAGQAALAALEAAVADVKAGHADVIVTAPIDKHSIQSEKFSFPGHTEYLQTCFADGDEPNKALMMMCAGNLRVAVATAHMPLRDVPGTITGELLFERIEALNHSLRQDFGIERPRIAVLGLNPHAGERGLLGTEEQEVIAPAIEAARNKRILAFGPYPADGFFGAGSHTRFDGVLAMYHDQGLAPFKTLAMDAGVNYTAGLRYVRTSPDHGTGYDIAAQGKASAESLRQALYLALDVYRNRRLYAQSD